ncbi:MAG: DapH/DapD/GlmU-related protein, partial [Gemmataceae bacterium]
ADAELEPTVSLFIHPTAIIEAGVQIGDGTSVWDNVHIRRGARIGQNCIIGEKTYIAPEVQIGDFVKINAMAYICAHVVIERGVMISAGVIFTNDIYPRATDPSLTKLLSSTELDEILLTTVQEGATIGAQATIRPGVTIGRFAMVGMGATVTKSVEPFQLVYGVPAVPRGWVDAHGRRTEPN